MGGFYLTGPNYIFSKITHPDLVCLCTGFQKPIDIELEKYLKNKSRKCISKHEFQKLFNPSNNMTEHIGKEEIYYYSITQRS